MRLNPIGDTPVLIGVAAGRAGPRIQGRNRRSTGMGLVGPGISPAHQRNLSPSARSRSLKLGGAAGGSVGAAAGLAGAAGRVPLLRAGATPRARTPRSSASTSSPPPAPPPRPECRAAGRPAQQLPPWRNPTAHNPRRDPWPAGMADADAQPPIGLADMLVDRAQPVMPGMAAAGLGPHLAGREIQFVMQHDHLAGGELQAQRIASPTDWPDRFMKVAGLSR